VTPGWQKARGDAPSIEPALAIERKPAMKVEGG
jgi:hypothetical protein